MALRILPLLLLLGGCASFPSDDWTARDRKLEWAFQAANAADGLTTMQIESTPGVREQNAIPRTILGPYPDPGATAVYFATKGLVHWMIARSLPPKWRPWFQGAALTESTLAIANNCDRGLCD